MKNIFLRFLSLSILIYITIFSIGKADYYSTGNFKLPGEYSEIYLYPKELLTEEGKVEVSNKIFRLQKNSKLTFFTFSASKEVQIIDNMNYFKNLTGYELSDENIFVKNSVLNDMFTIKDIENLYPDKKIIPLKSDLLKNNTEFIIKKASLDKTPLTITTTDTSEELTDLLNTYFSPVINTHTGTTPEIIFNVFKALIGSSMLLLIPLSYHLFNSKKIQ